MKIISAQVKPFLPFGEVVTFIIDCFEKVRPKAGWS